MQHLMISFWISITLPSIQLHPRPPPCFLLSTIVSEQLLTSLIYTPVHVQCNKCQKANIKHTL